jgi:hypothetical protein
MNAAEFEAAFRSLKNVLRPHAKRLAVKTDTPIEYKLVTKSPSPFPQHKGHPLEFGWVKIGKAYVSFHLMPLYMAAHTISPELKKRMQGKTCFNFKSDPGPETVAELKRLTEAALDGWSEKKWL